MRQMRKKVLVSWSSGHEFLVTDTDSQGLKSRTNTNANSQKSWEKSRGKKNDNRTSSNHVVINWYNGVCMRIMII